MEGELTVSPDSIYNPLEELKKKQEEELIRLKAERDAAEKAYQETLSSGGGRNIWEQLLVGLAPMALGAALGGETGIGSGAIGSRAGIRSYEEDADRRAKEEAFIAKSIFGTADKGYQNALDAQLGLQNDLAKSQVGFREDVMLENQKQANRETLKSKYGAGGKPDKDTQIANPLLANSAVEAAKELGKEIPDPLNITNEQAKFLMTQLKEKRAGERSDSSIEAQAKRADALSERVKLSKNDKALDIESKTLPGISWLVAKPSDKTWQETTAASAAHDRLKANYALLVSNLRQDNRGRAYFGNDSIDQNGLIATIIDDIKTLRGYGANFTKYEIDLAERSGGATQDFFQALFEDKALGRNPSIMAEKASDRMTEAYVLTSINKNAVPNTVNYNRLSEPVRNALRAKGINWDDQGRVQVRDAVRDYADILRDAEPKRSGVAPTATNAPSSNKQQPTTPASIDQRFLQLEADGLNDEQIRAKLKEEGFKVK